MGYKVTYEPRTVVEGQGCLRPMPITASYTVVGMIHKILEIIRRP